MTSTKDSKDIQSEEKESNAGHVHVHGPHCNHHHEILKPIVRNAPKIGRNDPCLCGSQKKYKKCCGN